MSILINALEESHARWLARPDDSSEVSVLGWRLDDVIDLTATRRYGKRARALVENTVSSIADQFISNPRAAVHARYLSLPVLRALEDCRIWPQWRNDPEKRYILAFCIMSAVGFDVELEQLLPVQRLLRRWLIEEQSTFPRLQQLRHTPQNVFSTSYPDRDTPENRIRDASVQLFGPAWTTLCLDDAAQHPSEIMALLLSQRPPFVWQTLSSRRGGTAALEIPADLSL